MSKELFKTDALNQFEKANLITSIMNKDSFYSNKILAKYSLEDLKRLRIRIEGCIIH